MLTELMNGNDELSAELKTLNNLTKNYTPTLNEQLTRQVDKVAKLFDHKRGISQK